MALGKSLSDVDNKMTYILGYRNLYNFAVLFVAFMAFLNPDAITKALSLVLVVLGLKWLLTQVRENLDVVYLNDLAANESSKSKKEAKSDAT